MQAAGYLVRVVIELSAGVQDRHDDFGGGTALFRVHVHRNAAAVVGYRHGFIGVNRHGNGVAMAGQRLVDRVVDDLEYHVMQAGAVVGVTDVHSRAFSNRLETL